jgi:hypothetical protein
MRFQLDPLSPTGLAVAPEPAKVVQTSNGYLGESGVQSISAGSNVTIDNTDPKRPVISSSGGGGGGGGANATNLAATLSASNTIVTSDTGTDATIPSVDATNAGVMTPTMKAKLDGIEDGAEVNNISDANATDLTDAGNSTLHYHSADRDRANHTGTQLAATISDFSTATDARISNAAGSSVASLSGGKIPTSQIPAVALTTVQTAASQAAMLALTAQAGDIVVRSDEHKSYMHNGGTAGTMADYTLLDTPTDAVTSVNSQTGTVVLAKGDVGLANVDNTSDANKPVSTAQQTAIDAKVADAINDGTTTVAPSQNAVFDALALKQPLDSDLTTIAGLTPTTDNFMVAAASAWASRTPAQAKTSLALVKGDVGLGSVDNTSDANKPVSTAQQTALNLKANLVSPSFTTPTLGVAAATSINKVALTAPATAATLTIADNKTLTCNNSLTLQGTDLTVMTFPSATDTIAGLAAVQTITGAWSFNDGKLILNGATSGSTTLKSGAAAGTSVVTLPIATDTLVGKATTDVLTNKDLTSTTNTYPNGFCVQMVSTVTSAVATGTTLIPFDDTIPQITEGNEYMTLAITPKSTTNKLVIETVFLASSSVSNSIICALFQDATANALATSMQFQSTATAITQVTMTHVMAAGTTSSTTFRVRGGQQSAGTMTFNGTAGVRRFGGVTLSSMVIKEYKA